ncbi:MAG TPA: Rieske (2Fe-2S) protein [Bacteroidales bacterium]|jgi:Rieske Fe-S protein|nr:Rieske (2Fe-2S) protein [Bacteroidales bacterium]
MAKKETQITRRSFLKYLHYFIWVPIIYAIGKAIKTSSPSETVKIAIPQNEGYTFYKEVIVFKEGSQIKAFSSRCTHLGCTIKKNEGDVLVCGCHGSRYNKKGEVLSGPAVDPLATLPYQFKGTQLWITTD